MDGQGRYQASTLELNFVNDVELMLQQIQKALEMSDKVVSKLESVKDDEVQCDQISKAFNTKLRVFIGDLDAKREKFVVLREAEVTNMFEQMAQSQVLLANELLKEKF